MINMYDLKQHPLSAAYPSMNDDEFAEFSANIQSIGLVNPITLHEGMVLDGWHRYCACEDTQTAFKSINLAEGADPVEYVKAQNKHRRHLTASQRAMVEVKLSSWISNGEKTRVTGQLRINAELKHVNSAKEMAEKAHVSERTIAQAKQVINSQDEKLIAAVSNGIIPLTKATKKEKPDFHNEPSPIKATEPEVIHEEYTELDQLKDEAIDLKSHIEDLTIQIATNTYDEENKVSLTEIVEFLKTENASLKLNLNAVTISRDGLINENGELKRQLKYYQRKLKIV